MNSQRPAREITVCADDYALSPQVDQAVLLLARRARLSATTCMSTSPRWPAAAAALRPLRSVLEVGLHFNLTESHGGAVAVRGLKRVIVSSYTRQLAPGALRDAWRRQLDAFEDALGTPPDFIDGHQHVHQLPGVRGALLSELRSRYPPRQMPWLRSTVPAGGLVRQPKAALVALLGGRAATRLWRGASMRCNAGFAGVYGFDAPDAAAYGARVRRWLQALPDGGLLMCHPATEAEPGDAIGRQRAVEYAFFMSDAFPALLEATRCSVRRRAGAPH